MLTFLKNKKATKSNSTFKAMPSMKNSSNLSRNTPKPLTLGEIVCLIFNFSVNNYQN